MRDLASVRPELESLDADAPRGSSTARQLQRRLLTIKAEDTTSAALMALENAPQDETTRLLRQRVELERLRVAAISSIPAPRRLPRPRLPQLHPLPNVRLRLPHLPSVRWRAPNFAPARYWMQSAHGSRATMPQLPHLPRVRWRPPTFSPACFWLQPAHGSRETMPQLPHLPSIRWRAPNFGSAWARLRSLLPLRVGVPHWRSPRISMRRLLPFAAAAVGVATVVVGAMLISALRPSAAEPQLGAVSSPSVEGNVAGGQSSPSPQQTAIPVRRVTFDELIIGAQLPDGWRTRGSAGSVQVAPFPDPFDRSLQVTSSPEGASSAACYRTRAETNISLDVFSDAPAGMAVSLRDPETGGELGVAVDADGSILLQPGNGRLEDAVISPDEWYHVSFGIDVAGGTVTLQVEPRDAIGFAGAEASVPFEWSSADARPELCVASPNLEGEAAYLDNVTVE